MRKLALLAAGILTLSVALAGCGQKTETPAPSSSGTSSSSQSGGESSAPKAPIKIGVQGPISGPYAIEGQGFINAIRLLADEYNAAGGINGAKIEVIPADDKGDPKESALAAQKLANEKVIAVVGSYNSTATEAAQGTYDEAGIVHITPSSTNTKLSQKGLKLFFRTASLDNGQAEHAADYLIKTLGKKKIAVIHDNTTYGKGLADWTKKWIEEKGGEVVFFDAITPGDKDFTAVLTTVKGKSPEAIYFTGYFSDGGLLLKQARDLGIDATFMAGDANNNPDFIKIAGVEAAKGSMITTPPQPQDLAAAAEFNEKYKAKYGEAPPSTWTVSAADAFRVVVEALKQSGATDGKALAEYMHTIKDFPGYTGTIGFDEKGDRIGSLHKVYIVNDAGELVLHEK